MAQPPADSPNWQPDYPQQELLPQQVQRRRRRWPLVVGAAVVVVAVVAGVLVWQLAGNGGGDRAAYCQRLRAAVGRGADNVGSLQAASGLLARLDEIRAVAPSTVRPQWDDLLRVVGESSGGRPPGGDVLGAMSDLRAIVADANANCGMHLHLGL